MWILIFSFLIESLVYLLSINERTREKEEDKERSKWIYQIDKIKNCEDFHDLCLFYAYWLIWKDKNNGSKRRKNERCKRERLGTLTEYASFRQIDTHIEILRRLFL